MVGQEGSRKRRLDGHGAIAPPTGITSELPLGEAEGLPQQSVASFDNLQPFPKSMLVHRIGALDPDRVRDIRRTWG
jgi:mRNA-degrading endonuclease toxin of MazEF toxin-antitoxin module